MSSSSSESEKENQCPVPKTPTYPKFIQNENRPPMSSPIPSTSNIAFMPDSNQSMRLFPTTNMMHSVTHAAPLGFAFHDSNQLLGSPPASLNPYPGYTTLVAKMDAMLSKIDALSDEVRVLRTLHENSVSASTQGSPCSLMLPIRSKVAWEAFEQQLMLKSRTRELVSNSYLFISPCRKNTSNHLKPPRCQNW